MDKIVKDALLKGKILREELDKKAAEEALECERQKKIKEDEWQNALQDAANRYISRIPELLTTAIGERKSSFKLVTCDSDRGQWFNGLVALIEPHLKQMELQFEHTSTTDYVYTSFDPDTGYDATLYHLEVKVPDDND